MVVTIDGTVLGVHSGVSRGSGRPFVYADVYDGEDLVKVFGVRDDLSTGDVISQRCRFTVDNANKWFFMAIPDKG